LSGEVLPIKIGFGFSLDSWKLLSGRFWTLDEKEIKQIIRINQLSETKVYPHMDVDKSSYALFKTFGFYCRSSKVSESVSYSSASYYKTR